MFSSTKKKPSVPFFCSFKIKMPSSFWTAFLLLLWWFLRAVCCSRSALLSQPHLSYIPPPSTQKGPWLVLWHERPAQKTLWIEPFHYERIRFQKWTRGDPAAFFFTVHVFTSIVVWWMCKISAEENHVTGCSPRFFLFCLPPSRWAGSKLQTASVLNLKELSTIKVLECSGHKKLMELLRTKKKRFDLIRSA